MNIETEGEKERRMNTEKGGNMLIIVTLSTGSEGRFDIYDSFGNHGLAMTTCPQSSSIKPQSTEPFSSLRLDFTDPPWRFAVNKAPKG